MTIIPLSNLDWEIITKVIRDTLVLLADVCGWLAMWETEVVHWIRLVLFPPQKT